MEKVYVTFGTVDYLKKIKEEKNAESFYLMEDQEGQGILVQESTSNENPFQEGYTYESIDSTGQLAHTGYVVLNNIPVTDEGRPVFEDRFKNRPRLIENEDGFKAIRVLRPLSNDTYIIMTFWESEDKFKQWQESNAYKTAHKKRGTSEGIDQKSIFPRESYVKRYTIVSE